MIHYVLPNQRVVSTTRKESGMDSIRFGNFGDRDVYAQDSRSPRSLGSKVVNVDTLQTPPGLTRLCTGSRAHEGTATKMTST